MRASRPSPHAATPRAALAALLLAALVAPGTAAPPERALATLPFESADDLIFLRARINGHGAWLLLDSGAGVMALERARERALGLRERGRRIIRGMGAGPVEAGMVRNVDVALGPLDLRIATAVAVGLDALRETAGHEVDGVLGYELLRRWVVAIDYAAGVVRLYEPSGFRYAGAGTVVPLRIEDGHAYAAAAVDLAGSGALASREYMIDTGASRALVDPDLIRAPEGRETLGGLGIGAARSARLARVPALRFGGVRFDGALGVTGPLRAIGAGLLRRFVAWFDYPHRRLILVPGPHLRDGFPADASGLLLLRSGGTGPIAVRAALAGTPAAAAGLRAGDVVERVDGEVATELGLDRLRALLRRDGAEVRLSVRRGAARWEVRLRLAKLL